MPPPIPNRWHDSQVDLVPQNTPAKRLALGFALFGLRLQVEGVAPAEIEATITINDQDGQYLGRLDLDTGDVERVLAAISSFLDREYGPWKREDVDRLRAQYEAG